MAAATGAAGQGEQHMEADRRCSMQQSKRRSQAAEHRGARRS